MDNCIIEKHGDYERMLFLKPPFDKRNPDPKKDYGIHGMDLRMIVRKNNNCTQFLAYLPVHLPHVSNELWNNNKNYNPFEGMGADVGYHAEKPQYEDQTILDCDLLEGGKCYCDGSSLRGEKWYQIFLTDGIDKIWSMLEEEWEERFNIIKENK